MSRVALALMFGKERGAFFFVIANLQSYLIFRIENMSIEGARDHPWFVLFRPLAQA